MCISCILLVPSFCLKYAKIIEKRMPGFISQMLVCRHQFQLWHIAEYCAIKRWARKHVQAVSAVKKHTSSLGRERHWRDYFYRLALEICYLLLLVPMFLETLRSVCDSEWTPPPIETGLYRSHLLSKEDKVLHEDKKPVLLAEIRQQRLARLVLVSFR